MIEREKLMNIFYALLVIMFSCSGILTANTNTITLTTEGTPLTNSNINVEPTDKPILPDVNRVVYMGTGQNISVNISATNINSYVRIMAYSTNLDFTTFTREKTRAIITFETLAAGDGYIHFQVDDNNKIIQRHIYKISVTNREGTASSQMPTPSLPDIADSTPEFPSFDSSGFGGNIVDSQAIAQVEYEKEKVQIEVDIANSLFKDKNYRKSLEAFSDIATKYPNTEEAINAKLKMAEIMFIEKNYNGSFNQYRDVFGNAKSQREDKAKSLYNMGIISRERRNTESALMYFLQTYRMYPDTEEGLNSAYEYAVELHKELKGATFIRDLSNAMSSEINYAKKEEAILLLADIYEKDRQYQNSYNTYERYIDTYGRFGKHSSRASNRMQFLSRNFLNIR